MLSVAKVVNFRLVHKITGHNLANALEILLFCHLEITLLSDEGDDAVGVGWQ